VHLKRLYYLWIKVRIISQFNFQCNIVMTIGIHLRANARSKNYSDKLSDLALWVITQNKTLRIEPVPKPAQIERAQEYFFRTFNVEHAGHDIAGGR
jgi:hypothetical protein